MPTTKITKINRAHIAMVDAAGLAIEKAATMVLMDGTASEALAALMAAKSTVVKDRSDANIFGTLRRKLVELAAAEKAAERADAGEPSNVVELAPKATRKARKAAAEPVVTDADAEAVMVANADADAELVAAVNDAVRGVAPFDAAATVDAYRSGMPWADRRAAVLALGDDERAAVFALFGQDEIEAYLDDAVLGVGMNPVFRSQVIARYEEIAPELGARARKAYEDNMPGDAADERPGPKTERKARKPRARKAAPSVLVATEQRGTEAFHAHQERGNADAAPAEAPAAPANPGRAGKGLKEQVIAWHRANPTTPAKAEELKKLFGAKWAGPIRIHQRNLVEAGYLVRVGDAKPETYVLADNAPADA